MTRSRHRSPTATSGTERRKWLQGRRLEGTSSAPLPEADISPVWELSPGLDPVHDVERFAGVLRRDAMFRRLLALADVGAAYVALVFALFILGDGRIYLRPAAVLLAPFVVLVSKAIGMYDRDQHQLRKTTIDEAPSIFQLSVLSALGVWVAEVVLLSGRLARLQVVGLLLANFVLAICSRSLVRAIALAVAPVERCIVLGNAGDAQRTADKLASSPGVKAVVVGRVALHEEEESQASAASRPLGGVRSLARVIEHHRVERVIIAPGSHNEDEILHTIRLVKALGVKVSVLPRLLEVVGWSSTFEDVNGIALLGVRQYGLSKSSQLLKRLMDVIGAVLALILLAPLLALVALAIKLDSRGSVLFRQPRIGRRGERFNMMKFRSMIENAEQIKDELLERNEAEGGLFKVSNDPRITRVGRYLRATSMDELPQLLNVLRGNMSLVGPRPLVPDEDALIEGWQRRRLAVKPGMTGMWQIFGSSRVPMHEMVKIDYLYGANWSIWLDLKILLRTIPYVVYRRGL